MEALDWGACTDRGARQLGSPGKAATEAVSSFEAKEIAPGVPGAIYVIRGYSLLK